MLSCSLAHAPPNLCGAVYKALPIGDTSVHRLSRRRECSHAVCMRMWNVKEKEGTLPFSLLHFACVFDALSAYMVARFAARTVHSVSDCYN